MTTTELEGRIAEILKPAINVTAPYAKVMIGMIAKLIAPAKSWDDVPWTPFCEGELPDSDMPIVQHVRQDLVGVAINSRYQVYVYDAGAGRMGRMVWLSIKALDKSARHDWRDLQRIKNEVVGPQYDAVEIYPAEDKLVDTSNQYHLWVFLDFKLPFGFNERCVGDGSYQGSVQRPFAPEDRPNDCVPLEQYADVIDRANARAVEAMKAKQGGKS